MQVIGNQEQFPVGKMAQAKPMCQKWHIAIPSGMAMCRKWSGKVRTLICIWDYYRQLMKTEGNAGGSRLERFKYKFTLHLSENETFKVLKQKNNT